LHLLVINSGSSSIKFSVFAVEEAGPQSLFEGQVSGIGTEHGSFVFNRVSDGEKQKPEPIEAADQVQAIEHVVKAIAQPEVPKVDAVGYRVVHPGAKLHSHVRIDDAVLHDLDEAVVFAPLHDPSAIRIIRAMLERFPQIPHIACFDTVFHETMPETATTYAIPEEYRERGVRRYGFHGLSCESIVEQMKAAQFAVPRRMAIAHLGSGCSVTALVEGRSVDTSMGLTPTGGVVMGTRPGDLDPGLVLYLLRDMPGSREESFAAVETLMNHRSGVAALSGIRNDMRDTREAATKGKERARLAVEVFTRSVRKAIGGYAWLLGGLDAIVFTGGIGEHDAKSRAEIASGLEEVGVILDARLNETEKWGDDHDMHRISQAQSKTEVLLIPAKEDWMIARHMKEMLGVS
jgi:acetate kinase